jgi:hypothetical protein
MRFDGWIFMAVSWLAILALFFYSLIRILRSKDSNKANVKRSSG